MTKAEIVNEIVGKTNIEKVAIEATIEAIMETIKTSMAKGENIYLRGFGTFLLKKRAEKIGRNITKNTAIKIPAHIIPSFKPSKEFVRDVKIKVKIKK
jgi:DNA-binding protein HU-beta